MNRQVNQNIRRYFWDVNFSELDFEKNSEYVISRILEHGDPEAIKWLFRFYNKKKIKKVLMSQQGFSKKSANFWSKVLDVDKNKIQCLKKSYQEIQKAHWPY